MNCAALLALLCQMLGVGCNGYSRQIFGERRALPASLLLFLAVMTDISGSDCAV